MNGLILAVGMFLTAPESELAAKLPDIFAKSAAHYRALDAAATPLQKDAKGELRTPHGYRRDTGELDMRSICWWTAGHFPGSLWYLYEATGDYFSTGDEIGHFLLKHGVGHKPEGMEV